MVTVYALDAARTGRMGMGSTYRARTGGASSLWMAPAKTAAEAVSLRKFLRCISNAKLIFRELVAGGFLLFNK